MRVTIITAEDLKRPALLQRWGRLFMLQNHFGRLLPSDIGRRVYEDKGILQIENQEQYEARTGRKDGE